MNCSSGVNVCGRQVRRFSVPVANPGRRFQAERNVLLALSGPFHGGLTIDGKTSEPSPEL